MTFDIMKLFENDNFISPGSIGGKIKKIREIRGLTQKQLGIMCGFSASSADVRIAQYEKNKKIPREKTLKDICEALNIDVYCLFDADMLPYQRMFHALFDIEDFHGLHPIKRNNKYYLEFSGPTVIGQDILPHDFDEFLKEWYEMYQQHLPNPSDTKKEKEKKEANYALWRYEYPINVAEENTKKLQNQMKMNHLQAQMDALNAEMQGEAELSQLDSAMADALAASKKVYRDITKESEFILLIKKLIEADIPIKRFSPEVSTKIDYDHMHIISIKTQDIINNESNKSYFAEFLCQIETMQRAGLNINRKITCKNNELYVTYEIASSQWKYLENLNRYWDDIIYIKERIGSWPNQEIDELNKKFLNKITGPHDMIIN